MTIHEIAKTKMRARVLIDNGYISKEGKVLIEL